MVKAWPRAVAAGTGGWTGEGQSRHDRLFQFPRCRWKGKGNRAAADKPLARGPAPGLKDGTRAPWHTYCFRFPLRDTWGGDAALPTHPRCVASRRVEPANRPQVFRDDDDEPSPKPAAGPRCPRGTRRATATVSATTRAVHFRSTTSAVHSLSTPHVLYVWLARHRSWALPRLRPLDP
jgi:hypothetical protein